MTQEEKAKAYDEALKRARQFSEHPLQEDSSNIVEYIFPELQESKDEKMMHQLHSWMKEFGGAEEYTEKVYTWLKSLLEKQGEKSIDNLSPQEAMDIAVAKCFEQGEQKSADKTEPKFKVGDWITTTDEEGNVTTEKIIEFWGDKVRLIDINGFYSLWPKHELNYYHLWTIQDAKDGDVLVSESTCGLGTWYCIFKSLDGDESMTVYCYLTRDGRFETKKELCFDKDPYNTKPATKEQRNTLLKAMSDAGYTFDFEKKELKKIGQNIEMVEALRMEYEKGRADVLRCIDPDVMVADFCSQPLSKTRSLASIYRQGIIDIIKRINRNEETSITSTHSIDDGGVQLPKP